MRRIWAKSGNYLQRVLQNYGVGGVKAQGHGTEVVLEGAGVL